MKDTYTPNRNKEPIGNHDTECPDHLSEEGKNGWKRLKSTLDHLGIRNQASLEPFAVAYAQWRHAKNFLSQNGNCHTVKDEDGNMVQEARPEVGIMFKSLDRVWDILVKLGVTPSGRKRLAAATHNPN